MGGHRLPRFALALLSAGCIAAPASADWSDLVQGAPHGANAIGLIDVSFVREQAESAAATKEIMETLKGVLSDKVMRGAFVAEFDLTSMEAVWEAGIVETTGFPTPAKIAKQTGGKIEEIEGVKVVWTPRNAYLGVIGDDRVVAYRPANRKALTKVLRDKKANGPHPLPPYLAEIVKRGIVKTPVTIALDLTDVISPSAVKEKLKDLTSLAGADVSLDEIAKLLADLQGITFTVQADDKSKGTLRVDFSSSPTVLNKVGKAMVLEVLAKGGANLPEMADWKSIVMGNSLTLSGKLEMQSLSHVLSLFNTPFSIGTMHTYASAADEAPEQSESQRQMLATKRYFGSVTKIIENVRGFKASTLGERALWCDREGRKIDQLPILDVDNDMLNYGSDVSGLLRGTGLTMRNVNMQAYAAMDKSMVGAGGGGGYGWGGYSWGGGGLPSAGYNAGAAARDTNNLNVKAQQNVAGQGAYLENMATIDRLTPAIRRAMTQKYKVEF